MRVGLVCPYSFDVPGGVQSHVLGLAGWLAAAGHEPAILAPGVVPDATLARLGLDRRHVTSLGGTLAIPWNGSVARVAAGPATARRVRRWLAHQRLDVLHLHEPVSPSAALWALLLARTPIVATFHVATGRSRLLGLAGHVLRRRLRAVGRTLAVSETAAAVARDQLGLDPVIVPNGIDVGEFRRPRATGSPPRVGFLGRRSEPRKGLAVLLAALPCLENLHGPVDVVVAGPGEAPLPPGVRSVGVLDDEARADLLSGLDVFVAPHLGGESFGLVLIEALAAGTQVVASDLPAFRDVLEGPEGRPVGRTFPVGDAPALARAIAATLADPLAPPAELRARAARFDWSAVGPAVLAAYADATCLFRNRTEIAGG